MAELFEKVKLKAKKIKLEYLIIIIATVAVLVIVFSSFSRESDVELQSVDNYVDMLENKLSQKLSQIDGAGKVTVLISVKRGLTTEIATEKKVVSDENGITTEEAPILVSGKPIVLSEIYPEIVGVIVIAKGASDLKVKMCLLVATQTFLDVTSDKIEILTMR